MMIGVCLEIQGQYDDSLKYLSDAEARFTKVKEKDKSAIAQLYMNYGSVYTDKGLTDKAIDSYGKAYLAFQDAKDRDGAARSKANLGSVYFLRSDFNSALKNYTDAWRCLPRIQARRLAYLANEAAFT